MKRILHGSYQGAALEVIAKMLPIDLLVEERSKKYNRDVNRNNQGEEELTTKWENRETQTTARNYGLKANSRNYKMVWQQE